jgi:ureidoglycolate hydrolase
VAGAMRTHRLALQAMTPETFADYGTLLTPASNQPPDYADAASEGWRSTIALEGTPELILARTSFVGLRFSKLEQHMNVTQAFIPVGGIAAAVAVARSHDDSAAPPPATAVRAFAVAQGTAYILGPGIWHSLDRYPLWEGHVDVVMLTAVETTNEAQADRSSWQLTREVDYSDEAGIEFEIVPGRDDNWR